MKELPGLQWGGQLNSGTESWDLYIPGWTLPACNCREYNSAPGPDAGQGQYLAGHSVEQAFVRPV